MLTLGLFGPWFSFGGERGYGRWTSRHLRAACPAPARPARSSTGFETVFDKLQNTFGLRRERFHGLGGFGRPARLAARVGLPHFCLLLNQQLGRPILAFADLVDW